MFVVLPLVIQINGKQIKLGIARPAKSSQPLTVAKVTATAARPSAPLPKSLRERLMYPGVN